MPFIALRNMAFYTAKCHVCGCKKPSGQSVRTAFGGVKYGLLCELTARIEVKNAMLFAHFRHICFIILSANALCLHMIFCVIYVQLAIFLRRGLSPYLEKFKKKVFCCFA